MKEIYTDDDLYFLGLENDDYERSNDWSKLKISKQVLDDFVPLSIFGVCFLDTGDKVEYQMIDEDDDWIYLDIFC